MRIGFDAKRAFYNNTGLGNYSRDSIRLLSNFYTNNKYFLYTPNNKYNKRLDFFKERKNIFIRSPKSLLDKALKSYWRSKSIVRDLFTNKIDVYHGLSHELPIGIEKTNIKTVVTIHDLIFIRYPKLFRIIDRKIYHKKFKSAVERADKVIAISKQTKDDIINFFSIPEEKIEVVYQGCNKIFQKEINKEMKEEVIYKYNLPNKYLLYVGSIEERKNLLTLLYTLKELPDQKLVVIGNGKSYKKKCVKYISENGLFDRIIFLSKIEIEEMASIYQNAEILIYPSLFEGFGLPILEALFSKLPVITSKGGCFAETGGPYSKYISPLSVEEMKKAILEIQDSKEIQKLMKNKGIEYAQRFTDDKIAKNIMKVYDSLLN